MPRLRRQLPAARRTRAAAAAPVRPAPRAPHAPAVQDGGYWDAEDSPRVVVRRRVVVDVLVEAATAEELALRAATAERAARRALDGHDGVTAAR